MATIFQTPTRSYTPSVTPFTPVWQQSPAKFFSKTNIPKPVNVFKLLDGTYTEQQPTSWDTVAVTYYGGHVYTVTAAEAIALTTAGYGSNLTVDNGAFSNDFQVSF